MMPMSITHHKISKQKGVSIVTAIFLVIVLALMGAGMVSLLTTSQQSVSHEITSAKTYMAGRSCLQWGMYQAIYSAAAANGSNTTTFNNATSGLSNSQCVTAIDTISSDSLIFYNINTVATFGSISIPEFSRREMHLQFQP